MKDENVSSIAKDASTSLTLLESAKDRENGEARKLLASIYMPLIDRWVKQAGFTGGDADDLRQEVFATALGRLKNFNRRRTGSFRKWLRTILKFKVQDHWGEMEEQIGEQLPEDCPAQAAFEPFEEDEIRCEEVIEFVRSQQSARNWQMFNLFYLEQRSPDEIAARLGMTRAAFYVEKGRLLERIYAQFPDWVAPEQWE